MNFGSYFYTVHTNASHYHIHIDMKMQNKTLTPLLVTNVYK